MDEKQIQVIVLMSAVIFLSIQDIPIHVQTIDRYDSQVWERVLSTISGAYVYCYMSCRLEINLVLSYQTHFKQNTDLHGLSYDLDKLISEH